MRVGIFTSIPSGILGWGGHYRYSPSMIEYTGCYITSYKSFRIKSL